MSTKKKTLLVAIITLGLGAGYFAAKLQGMGQNNTNYDGFLAPQASVAPSTPVGASNSTAPPTQSPTSSAQPAAMKGSTSPATTATPGPNPNAFEVRIPVDLKTSAPVYRMRKGEKATFSVVSAVDGKLAIHGITQNMAVRENQSMQFGLQAEHTGRFPMHVHGPDGSHLEVGIVEILPQ